MIHNALELLDGLILSAIDDEDDREDFRIRNETKLTSLAENTTVDLMLRVDLSKVLPRNLSSHLDNGNNHVSFYFKDKCLTNIGHNIEFEENPILSSRFISILRTMGIILEQMLKENRFAI